jgi:hypothetical protein
VAEAGVSDGLEVGNVAHCIRTRTAVPASAIVAATVFCSLELAEIRQASFQTLMDFTDPVIRGVSVFHCHPINHEDKGMMARILFE